MRLPAFYCDGTSDLLDCIGNVNQGLVLANFVGNSKVCRAK